MEEIKEIIRQCQQGDESAFEQLVKNYQAAAISVAYAFLQDAELARDIAQEAFIRVYRSINRFDPDKNFYTWLRQIVVNLCIDYRRRRKGKELPLESSAAGIGANALEDVERKEQTQRIRTILDRLPAKYRTVLVLRDIEGLETQEIAGIINKKEPTVRWMLHRARQMFRAKWKPQTPHRNR
ncbi:MAG: sigma-70 family RNA polymerase sigma factor [Planctomycetes bacterium]|nr:sigma-70 family RNA polymerase sigma factor [Planctomycetota bacterium]